MGMSMLVLFAAMMPAIRATQRTSPFGTFPFAISFNVSGSIETLPLAIASRSVTGLPVTSTIFALPRLSLGLRGTMLVRWIEGRASVVRRGPGELGLRLDHIRDVDRRAIRTYVFTGSADIREYAPAPRP